MSSPKQLLVIGRHPDMMARITGLLAQHGYQAKGAITNDEAFERFNRHDFDGVVIGGGVDADSRSLFETEFLKLRPSTKIIHAHPQTLLAQLEQAFAR
jgi:hypothetical protein